MFRRGGGTTVAYNFDGGDVKKLHTSWPDGRELVEEYSLSGGGCALTLRKRRRPTTTGAEQPWEVLFGDPGGAAAQHPAGGLLQESSSAPRCVRTDDAPGCFTWRVRNAPWPSETYRVSLDEEAAAVVVATTNKKFYKRLAMPEMQLLGLALDPSRLAWEHGGATLTVRYTKPPALLAEELADAKAAAALRAQEPPGDCRQQ